MNINKNYQRLQLFQPECNEQKSGKNEIRNKKQQMVKGQNSHICSDYTISSQDLWANYNMADINFISHAEEPKLKHGVNKFDYNGANISIFVDNNNHRHDQIVAPFPIQPDFRDEINKWEIEDKDIPETPSNNDADTNIDTDYNAQVNGEIDEAVSQGSTGDCWLISAVLALNSTDTGKAVIKNSVTANDDGSVTINFKGLDVSYTISANEIKRADTDNNTSDAYTNGDNDMLVLELATEKLKKDIAKGDVKLPEESGNFDECEAYSSNDIEGGYAAQMVYFLTGVASDDQFSGETSEDLQTGFSKEEVYNILKNTLDSENTSLTFGLYIGEHNAKLTNGEYYSVNLEDGGHAFAITNITDSTVTFVNPWDTTTSYTMTWNEFANLGVGCLSSTDLSSVAEDYANIETNENTDSDNEIENDNISDIDEIVSPQDDENNEELDINSIIERLNSGDLTAMQDLEDAGISCKCISRQRDNALVRVDFEYNDETYKVNIEQDDTEYSPYNINNFHSRKPNIPKFHLYDQF